MTIFKHNQVLLYKVRREFFNNCLWYQVDSRYFEQKSFQEALLFYIFNLVELNPTNKVAIMIHQLLKSFIFKEPEHRRGVYKQIRYKILPVLWKDHKAIERKKQRKLTFLANELSNPLRKNHMKKPTCESRVKLEQHFTCDPHVVKTHVIDMWNTCDFTMGDF